MKQCPFTDYSQRPIFEGDIIRHPNGLIGKVVFIDKYDEDFDKWRVKYEYGVDGRLCLQVGDKGRACVVPFG